MMTLNPSYVPTQKAIRSFLTLIGVSSANQDTILRPETRANRLFTVNDMLSSGMQVTGAGFASELGTWPIEFNRPSTISAISHSWDLCGYWNYSTALPIKQDSQLTKREALDYLISEKSGGLVFANGMTEENEYMFASPYRDIYAGGLYDIRQDGSSNNPFVVSAEFDSLKEIYYQATTPVITLPGTIWIDSSVAPNVVSYWDGAAWIALGGIASFNGRSGIVVPVEGDYTLDLLGDVDTVTTAPVTGDVLKYNGASWEPAAEETQPPASETVSGIAEIATQIETDAGANDTRIVSPAKLAAFKTNVLDVAYSSATLPAASETAAGIAEIATQIETDAGTDDTRMVSPAKLTTFKTNVLDAAYVASPLPASSETVSGIAEVATQTETDTGTDDARIVSPAKLAAYKTNVLNPAFISSAVGLTVVAAPTTSGDAGNAGDVASDANYFYWYDGAAWQRVAANPSGW